MIPDHGPTPTVTDEQGNTFPIVRGMLELVIEDAYSAIAAIDDEHELHLRIALNHLQAGVAATRAVVAAW